MGKRESIAGQHEAHILWDRFRQGNRAAFGDIYNEYAHALIVYGFRIVNDGQAIKDAIQDLFVELWRSRENLQQVHHVKAYLFASLRYKLLQKRKLTTIYSTEENMVNISAHVISPEAVLLDREEETETIFKVRNAVRTLSRRQQEAVTLKFYHGFTNEQIAEIMGINYQSATNILHRAFLLLRQHFNLPVILLFSALTAI